MTKSWTFILLFGLAACTLSPKEAEVPADLIPQDSMVLLVHDLATLESHIQQKYIQLERYAKIMRMSGDSLLSENGISRERYESSFLYYSKNPKLLSDIYDSVLVRLEGVSVMDNLPEY